MIPCLNPVTTGGYGTLKETVLLCERLGFGGFDAELKMFEEYARGRDLTAARKLLEEHGVALAAPGPGVEFRRDEVTFRAGLRGLPEYARKLRALGCTRTVTWLYPGIEGDPKAEMRRTAKRLKLIAQGLGGAGIRFGLEWVGPATSRRGKNPFVHTLDRALELVATIHEPNVGLLVDSFHWFTANHTYEDLEALDPRLIVHVHVNDAPKRPVGNQIDNQRLLPGQGIIDLVGFLRILKKKGYDGFLSVEVFSSELKQLGWRKAARLAKKALDSVLAQV
jgi:sugar phosphate isomerase/epimerase